MKVKEKKQRRLSYKEKGFVHDFVKTKNGTRSVLNNYDVKKENTAAVIASENLRKPHIISAIDAQLEKIGFTSDFVLAIHKRNMQQKRDLRTSQVAVKDYYAITGMEKNIGTQQNININVLSVFPDKSV